MRPLAILLALAIPASASAGMLGGGRGMLKARTSPVAARYVPRVGQAFVGERGEVVTVTRASVKNCLVGGVWTQAGNNTACIGDAGLSVEGSRTQYALANCTAPADQTVTLAAGVHSLWLEGTGTVAAAVGTAVATGLPCAATAAAACSFTVTTGGTVTLDVTGAVDRMQVENGARSSLICATSTPVTRAADVVSGAHGLTGVEWSARVSFISPSTNFGVFMITGGPSSEYCSLYANTATSLIFMCRGRGNIGALYTSIPISTGVHNVVVTKTATKLIITEGAKTVEFAGDFDYTLGNTISLGVSGGNYYLSNGALQSITTCNTSSPEDCQ